MRVIFFIPTLSNWNCQGVSIVLSHQLEILQSKRPLYVLTPFTDCNMIPCWGAWWKSSLFRLREKAIFKMLHYSLDQALSSIKKHNRDPHHLSSWKISFHIYISSASSIGFTKSVCGMRPSNMIQLVLLLKHKWMWKHSEQQRIVL